MSLNINGLGTSGVYSSSGVEQTEQTGSQGRVGKSGGDQIPGAGSLGSSSAQVQLEAPRGSINLAGVGGACASLGASVMAIIQQATSDMVRDNREVSYAAGMQSAEMMEKQADKMRDMAKVQLACAIIQGGLQIAGGLFQGIMSGKGIADAKMTESQKALFNTKISCFGQIFGAAGTFTEGISKNLTTGYEADIKDLEAEQKRIDAYADQVKSITESLQQTVSQAISSLQTISQSMVETNKRILG